MKLDSHENFLIVLKGKTQVTISACYRQGLLNLDCVLELPKELLQNTDAWWSHPRSIKSEGRGLSLGVGTEEREWSH